MPFTKIKPRQRGRVGQRKQGCSYRIGKKLVLSIAADTKTLAMLGIQPGGSRVDLFEGTGADTGRVAIAAARDGRGAFRANGTSQHRSHVNLGMSDTLIAFLGGADNAATPTTYVEWEIEDDMLVLDLRRPLPKGQEIVEDEITTAKTGAEYAV